MPERVLTIRQAAKQLDCSEATIRRAIQGAHLRAQRLGFKRGAPWVVTQSDLTAWRDLRAPFNRPLDEAAPEA